MKSQLLGKVNNLLEMLEQTPGKPGDLNHALQTITRTAWEFFAADDCVIFAIKSVMSRFTALFTLADGPLIEYAPGEQAESEDLIQQVLKKGIVIVEDLDAMPEYQIAFAEKEELRAFVALSLCMKYRQVPLGVLCLTFEQRQTFSSSDQELLRVFAERASGLLQETWLFSRLQKVARIGQEINQELDTVDALFTTLQRHAAEVLDVSHALLLTVYQRQTSILCYYMQEEGRLILYDHEVGGACQYTMETRQTVFIEYLSEQAASLPFQIVHVPDTEPKESYIFVPLLFYDEPLGVLSIQHPDPYAYTQQDCYILEVLASYVALAMHNIRLYRNLSQLNEAGGILTQHLDAKQTLQLAVDKIRDATRADLVVLYPYEPAHNSFGLLPCIAGELLDPTSIEAVFFNRPGSIIMQMLHRKTPIFEQQSSHHTHIRQGSFGQSEQVCSTAALPLRMGEEAVGVLFVNFRQPQRFDSTQKLFIEGLARYAAVMMKNAQAFDMLSQRRLQELVILQHIDRELSRTLLELESFLHTLLKLANEQVLAEEAAIMLYNPRSQMLEVAAAIGPHAEVRLGRTVSLHESRGITRWVLEYKLPARVDNVHLDPQWRDLYVPVADEILSELDVPILSEGEVVGILNFESTHAAAFHHEDEDFLVTLAGQIALAIKNAQAYEREKRLAAAAQARAAEAQALNEISKEITSQLDLTHVFDLILEKALALTHCDQGSVYLYDPEREDLWMAAWHGEAKRKKGLRLRLDQGIVGYTAASQRVCNILDVIDTPWNDIYVELFSNTRSELAAPMLEGRTVRGVLNIESPFPSNFHESDERLLQGLADLAVVALQNAERYAQAEREAKHFALLYKAGQELGKITEFVQLKEAYHAVVQIAEEHSQCDVAIQFYDHEAQELVLTDPSDLEEGPAPQQTPLGAGADQEMTQLPRTIVIPDTRHLPAGVIAPLLADAPAHSLVIAPILFEDQYYGNLRLSHPSRNYFQQTDILFFEGLAQVLASTIYRLETVRAHQEFKQRAIAAEAMSSMGQSAFELTHRWGNDLGLVRTYVNTIQTELKRLNVQSPAISEKLDHIVRAVGKVLDLSRDLKEQLLRWGEAGDHDAITIHPRILLEEARDVPSLPPPIQLIMQVDPDVASVKVVHNQVIDILHNLITNAIEVMPDGGTITLGARNSGRWVALEVSDQGSGIPEPHLKKVFHLFYSTKRSTGFGLWSARRNALSNHGELEVRTNADGGATFTLLLPNVEGETL